MNSPTESIGPNSAPAASINIKTEPGTPRIFVEGMAQMQVGFPTTRLLLHSHVEKDDFQNGSIENRFVAVNLIMPTVALIEMAQNILNVFANNKEQLLATNAEMLRRHSIVMEAVSPVTVLTFPTI